MALSIFRNGGGLSTPHASLWDDFFSDPFLALIDPAAARHHLHHRQHMRVPRFRTHDEGDHHVLVAETPGLAPEQLQVEVKGDRLTVRGTSSSESSDANSSTSGDGRDADGSTAPPSSSTTWTASSRRYEAFERSWTLPPGVAPEDVIARYEHGVLSIRVPKGAAARREETAQTIPIQR